MIFNNSPTMEEGRGKTVKITCSYPYDNAGLNNAEF